MALLSQIVKKLLALSAATLFVLALLTFDPSSKTFTSEVQADECDWDYYQICLYACVYTCGTTAHPNCDPGNPYPYCDDYCRAESGC